MFVHGVSGRPGVLTLLVFQLDGQRFALHAAGVSEVAPAVTVARLPAAPAIVEGLIDVRGQVVPVLDIRSRFGLAPRPAAYTDHLVIARAAERQVAIRADQVLELLAVRQDQVADARHAVPDARWVAGVVKLPDGLVLIHDLAEFLSAAEAADLDAALAARAGSLGGPA